MQGRQALPRLLRAEFAESEEGVTDRPLMSLTFTLPWPPSVNTEWRHIILGGKFKKARAQTILSEAGRDYRVNAIEAMRVAKVPRGALKGRLSVHATAYPPDRRQRDLDNIWKGMLDALKHAGVIVDDGHIDDLRVVRGPVRPQGLVELTVSEIAVDPVPLELAFERSFSDEPKPRGLLRKTVTIDTMTHAHSCEETVSRLLDKPPF